MYNWKTLSYICINGLIIGMIDISKQKIDINCDSCNRKIKISLMQVANEDVVTCNCGTEIKLQDKKGSVKKAIRDVSSVFQDFRKTLKRFNK